MEYGLGKLDVSRAAAALHQRSLVIDTLVVGPFTERILDNLRAGGVKVAAWTVAGHEQDFEAAIMKFEELHWLLEKFPEKMFLATSAAEIERVPKENRLACVIAFQGGDMLGHRFHRLTVFWRMGLRIFQPTYNERNNLGDGCLEPENRGLTHFGIQIVRDCNRLGILLDVAHAGVRMALDMVEHSRDPVINSHAGAYALQPNPRNARDDVIKAVAASGGVHCIPLFSDFIGDTRDDRWPTVDDYVKHVDYVADLVGIEHVGLGGDILEATAGPRWDNTTLRKYPEICGGMNVERHQLKGMPNHSTMPMITDALLRRGYVEGDIQKIMGLNLLRLYRQVWRG